MTIDKMSDEEFYLEWWNNYLTIETIAEHYGVSVEYASEKVSNGRRDFNLKERVPLENNKGVDIENLVSELCDVVLNFDYEPLVYEGRITNSAENEIIHNKIKQTLFNHGIHGGVYDAEYLKSKVQPWIK
jgi:hypothetical protein